MTLHTGQGEPMQPTVQGVIDNLRFEAIEEHCGLASSYALSAREAAWRGDRHTLSIHLSQLRLTVIAALQESKQLGKPAEDTSDAPQEKTTGRVP